MPAENWIDETLYDGWGQRFRVKHELARVRSDFQEIIIFESETHGRVLLLDGVIQVTETDEFVYQEMIAHVPMLIHGNPRNVLIIGAGDGGVLRRVIQHATVERAIMVEIDGEVIRLSKTFLPVIGGDAWNDERTEVIVGDGVIYLELAEPNSVDVIIVDSTDPIGVGEVLFTESFYRHCHRVLTEDGIIVNQCGVPFMQSEEIHQSTQRRSAIFPFVTAYAVAVPTYVGGFMTLGIASKASLDRRNETISIERAAERAGILGHTEYWTPQVHAGAFSLPPYIARLLRPAE